MILYARTDTLHNYFQSPVALPIEVTPDFSPEDELEQKRKEAEAKQAKKDKAQDTEDEKRREFMSLLEYSSKKTQVAIYLAVALERDPTSSLVKSLNELQQENTMAKGYAEYTNNHTQVA